MKSSIPHIVWMLWLNFQTTTLDTKNSPTSPGKEPKFDEAIGRYFTQAKKVNSNWDIRILGTPESLLYYLTSGLPHPTNLQWAIDYINLPDVSTQKKSDVIRILLLQHYGGVWIDASTFLISSLDWIDEHKAGFICPYVHIDQYVQFSIPPITYWQDKLKTSNYDKWLESHLFKSIQWGAYAKDYPFVPENWFLAAEPEHPIINDTVRMCKKMCMYIVSHKLNKTDIETLYATYNMKLLYGKDKLFTLPNLSFKDPMLLHLFWEIGYLSHYTELYIALKNYMRKSTHSYRHTSKNLKRKLGKYGFTRRFYKSKCTVHNKRVAPPSSFNHCSDVVIKSSSKPDVYLFSASLMRYFKWANTADERSASSGSLVEKLLKGDKTKEEILRYFKNNYQTFIKFGAWTRDSPLLDLLFKRL